MDEKAPHAADIDAGSFGAKEAYYSRSQGKTKPSLPAVLTGILPPSASEEVKLVRRNWHQPIREALRSETGLRFGSGQGAEPAKQIEAFTNVTVEIVDGVSEPLAVIARDHPDAIAWWVLLNRRKLESAAESLRALERRVPEIIQSRLGRRLSENDPDAVTRSHDLIKRLLEDDIDKPIIERMRTIDRDWLGAYFFRQGRIELYAPAIALWSEYCGVHIEDMAIVVLAHELAHAFTHVGRDIDGRVWTTNDFAEANTSLVEGLAQFYADRVCDRLMGRRPSVRTAFDLLNENQAAPYREFLRWKQVGPFVGEAVRQALIDCRVSRIKDHNAYYTLLQTAHSRLASGETGRVGRDELFQ